MKEIKPKGDFRKCPYCWGKVTEHSGVYVCESCGKLSSEGKECGKCVWWRAEHKCKRETLPDDVGECWMYPHPYSCDPMYTLASDECAREERARKYWEMWEDYNG